MDQMCMVGLADGSRDDSHEYSGREIKGKLFFMQLLGFFLEFCLAQALTGN